MLGDQLEDPLGRRALGEDDPGGTDAERVERGQVARVPEEELRHGEDDVVLADIEHAARVPLVAEHRAVHGMDGALRLPRADPVVNFQSAMSSFVVGAGSSSSVRRARAGRVNDSSTTRISLSQLLPSAASRIAASVVSSATTTPASRVVEVVGVVLRLEKRVRLGGDRADLLRAVPERDEARRSRRARAARGPRALTPSSCRTLPQRFTSARQLRVRRRAVRADQRGAIAATLLDVAVDEPASRG